MNIDDRDIGRVVNPLPQYAEPQGNRSADRLGMDGGLNARNLAWVSNHRDWSDVADDFRKHVRDVRTCFNAGSGRSNKALLQPFFEPTAEQPTTQGLIEVDDRLTAIRKDGNGITQTSQALWNRTRLVGKDNVLGPSHDLHTWRTHYSPQSRPESLLNRIKRKLGLG